MNRLAAVLSLIFISGVLSAQELPKLKPYSEKEMKEVLVPVQRRDKWGYANACKMVETFDYWNEGEDFKNMSKEKRQVIEDMTHKQLAVGGYRLAHILNRIFK